MGLIYLQCPVLHRQVVMLEGKSRMTVNFPTDWLTAITATFVRDMESFYSSNSPSPEPGRWLRPPPETPSQPIVDRISRAFDHPIRLLHRAGSNFFVLGATGNVYTVSLSAAPTCTCPDRTCPCKHILFVLICVLGTPPDDACLRRSTLRPCQLHRLLATPTSPESLAAASVRGRFHQLPSQGAPRQPPAVEVEDGAVCPVCLEEMRSGEGVVACESCRNPVHRDCMSMWRRSKRKRTTSCVICRARWSGRADKETYHNLSAYLSEGDGGDGCGGPCGALLA